MEMITNEIHRTQRNQLAAYLGISNTRAERCFALGIEREQELYTQNNPPKSERRWHRAPDGSACCCTAEDRRYGCGCR